MLKSMMTIYNNVDGSKFHELEAFLKRKSRGYEPKKSKVFSKDDVVKFLKNASDEEHLLHKVMNTLNCNDCAFIALFYRWF